MTIEKRLIGYNPLTGVREDYIYDHADDKIRIMQSQDVAPVLAEAARLRSHSPGFKSGFVHKASLSLVQCIELMKLGIMDRGFGIRDEAAFNIWLNENNKFKATEGQV